VFDFDQSVTVRGARWAELRHERDLGRSGRKPPSITRQDATTANRRGRVGVVPTRNEERFESNSLEKEGWTRNAAKERLRNSQDHREKNCGGRHDGLAMARAVGAEFFPRKSRRKKE